MLCALIGQDIRCAFTGPLVLWFDKCGVVVVSHCIVLKCLFF